MSKPLMPVTMAPPQVNVTRAADGALILSSPMALAAHEEHLGQMLRRWSAEAPERTFLAERTTGGDWRRLTYAQARAQVDALSQALLAFGLGPERPLMILSGNSINHGLLTLAAMQISCPVAPVSPAYALMSADHAKLKAIRDQVRPAMIYAESGAAFAKALAALAPLEEILVLGGSAAPEGVTRQGAASWQRAAKDLAELLAVVPGPAVDEAFNRVRPDTVAKLLFTSGSTGEPKGVINTQRMLCSNQQMLVQVTPFYAEQPPVLVDWLPWHHTFGGNHNFNLVLRNGGTLYIDGGKPAPGLIEQTARNLREISPTAYFNVPAGYAMLLPLLETDAVLRASFFRELRLIFYAAAALPQDLWERLEALSMQELGTRVMMTSAWGSTETAPLATAAHWPLERAGVIGLPVPGVSLKLVPSEDKLEVRVKGPNVTPGYLGQAELTRAAFDEDGYYRIGDAVRLADPDDPLKGLVFDGRIAEDFKLTTGTWVKAGMVRIAALEAAAPALQDLLVAGHDRDAIALLAWPNLAGCRALAGAAADALPLALIAHPAVRTHVTTALRRYNAAQQGSSTRIARVLLMADPPDIDANEITDKGYINQRAGLTRRAQLVRQLYAAEPTEGVIVL